MQLGLFQFGLAAFLTVTFSAAFVAATMGAMAVTRPAMGKRRGMNPMLMAGLVTLMYAVVVHLAALTSLRNLMRTRLGPGAGGELLILAMVAVACATMVVARVGLARRILGAAYIATAVAACSLPAVAANSLPFVASLSRNLYEAPALMASYFPSALGLFLGALMAWSRSRERAAFWGLARRMKDEVAR